MVDTFTGDEKRKIGYLEEKNVTFLDKVSRLINALNDD